MLGVVFAAVVLPLGAVVVDVVDVPEDGAPELVVDEALCDVPDPVVLFVVLFVVLLEALVPEPVVVLPVAGGTVVPEVAPGNGSQGIELPGMVCGLAVGVAVFPAGVAV